MARPESAWLDPRNAGQAAAWNGAEGERWTAHAHRYDRACDRFDRWLFDAADIAGDDLVLDIGCGCGVSTRRAARLARSGTALGLDISAPMIRRARERCREEGIENARFEQGDVQVYPFPRGSATVAISRFGCMFFADPLAAFRNVGQALRPGARLTLLTWRPLAENEWVVVLREAVAAGRSLPDRPPGAPGPFGMADAAATKRLLDAAGFGQASLVAVNAPVFLGADRDDAFAYASGMGMVLGLLEGLDEAARARALERLSSALGERATANGVRLEGAAWLVSARRE